MPLPRSNVPKLFGRYELASELAQSYLGALWAVKVNSGEGEGLTAMVRRITVGAGAEQDLVDRLAEAAWTAMEVQHDLIPKVADVIVQESEIGVVSDYVEGMPLRAVSRQATIWRKPVPAGVAMRVASDALEALCELHRQARDFGDLASDVYGGVTPDSLLVGTDGRVRLLDIIVAGAASSVPAMRDDPERVAYAAPEQLATGMLPDARADLFCVGILLWELLSNRRLFVGFGESAAQKVLLQKIPRLDEVKRGPGEGDLPRDLVDLVARALDRDSKGRPQSADEMLAALRNAGLGVASPEETATYLLQVGERDLERQRTDLGPDRSTQPGPRKHLSTQFRSIRPPGAPAARRRASGAPATNEPAAPAGGSGKNGPRRHKQTLLGVAPMTAGAPPAQKTVGTPAAPPKAAAVAMPPELAAAVVGTVQPTAQQPPPAPSTKARASTMMGIAPAGPAAPAPTASRGAPPPPSRAVAQPAPAAATSAVDGVDDRWSTPGTVPPTPAPVPAPGAVTEPPPFKRRAAGKQTLLGVAPPGPGSHYPSLPTPVAAGLPVGGPVPAPEDLDVIEVPNDDEEERTVVAPSPFAAAEVTEPTRPSPSALAATLAAFPPAPPAGDAPLEPAAGSAADDAPVKPATAALAAAIAQAAAAAPAAHHTDRPAAAESVEDQVEGTKLPPPMLHDRPSTKVIEPQAPVSSSRFGTGFLAGVGTTLASVAIGALVVALVGGKFTRRPPAEVPTASAEPATRHSAASPAPKASQVAPAPVPSASSAPADAGSPALDAGTDAGLPTGAVAPPPVAPVAPGPVPAAPPRPKKAYVPDEI
jgi:eukaryotic-like serine/threonine-protein kinase